MNYSFASLSPADFEDLVRELIGREFGVRFEAFSEGPDDGIDGRHSSGGKAILLQAKHYSKSKFSALKSAMKSERKAINQLIPERYVLATSCPLTPANKKMLASEIGPSLKNQSDIFGPDDLNALLRKHPDVEKAHIKLWLSSSAVLDRLVNSAAHTFNAITRDEIEAKVHVYAHNPSFAESRSILENQHVLIISGPPGVGKTTLAEILSYTYIGEDWKLVAIRSLDDGFAAIVDSNKQVFLFDDFLGKIALDAHALAAKESDLARFMKRVRKSPNARFILTTRAYILEEACRSSEQLADKHVDISKYVLDVGIYTRRIRARILYNHLLVAGTPQSFVRALIESGNLPAIVDHKNYNPRVVEWMTDEINLSDIEPAQYADAFLSALANPRRLWDTAFRTHIPQKCRNLLIALFFCSEHGVDINELQNAFEALHQHLCQKYGHPHGPKDFEEATKILEGSFLAIRSNLISYINPSLRDYMHEYVADYGLLLDCALTAQKVSWTNDVWNMAKKLQLDEGQLRDLTRSLKNIAMHFDKLPIWKQTKPNENSYRITDTSNGDRIELLLEWWEISKDDLFATRAVEIAKNPIDLSSHGSFSSWRDATVLVELTYRLGDKEYYKDLPVRQELADILEKGLCSMLEVGMAIDELATLSDTIEDFRAGLSAKIHEAARKAIQQEFNDVHYSIEDADSTSTLDDHISELNKLAPRADISANELAKAISIVEGRIVELEEDETVEEAPSFTGPRKEPDKFDDIDLQNLFQPLLQTY